MDKAEYGREVGMVAGMIAANLFDEALQAVRVMRGGGAIDTYDLIAQWAVVFVDKNLKTDWEESELPYEDSVMQFATNKISELEGN